MITRLTLHNWRAYDHLDLPLAPGTTFIVAPNGVGKTSLLEGAAWALFGEAALLPRGAVRLGSASATATATAEVSLPDGRQLRVSRPLPPSVRRGSASTPTATVDGVVVPPDELPRLLNRTFQTEPSILARLVLMRDQAAPPDELNLTRHLCGYLGIDGLQEALAEVADRKRAAERDIRLLRSTGTTTASERDDLRAQLTTAEQQVPAAETAYQEALSRVQGARDRLQTWQNRHDQAAERDRQLQQLQQLTTRAAQILGQPVTPGRVIDALDAAAHQSAAALDQARQDKAFHLARAAHVRAALTELEGSQAACPVCRRPLSEDDKEAARREHDNDLQQAASSAADAERRESEYAARQRQLAQLARAAITLTSAAKGFEPAPPGEDRTVLDAELHEAEQQQQGGLEALISARSGVQLLRRKLAEAEEDLRNEATLQSLYSGLAQATAAEQAIQGTVDSLLADTVAPLSTQVAAQWRRVFEDRGDIDLTANGDVTRLVNGDLLPFSSFSTGERMGLQLVLRLLLVEAATRADFMWIDEPLEHLDPNARRLVANLLARATGERLRQVVVTTYEEPLARRLAAAAPGAVHLQYVRTSPS